jgi:DNA-binding protein H-NS
MPKQSLTSMSVDALLKLKDDVLDALGRRATELKQQLSRLGGSERKTPGRKSRRRGWKVPPKYRSPKGETWAGSGATPVWLREAIKSGKKADDFLIAKPIKKTARKAKKKKR